MKAFAAFNSTMNYDEKQKAFFIIFTLICIVAAGVCLIVDMAIN